MQSGYLMSHVKEKLRMVIKWEHCASEDSGCIGRQILQREKKKCCGIISILSCHDSLTQIKTGGTGLCTMHQQSKSLIRNE